MRITALMLIAIIVAALLVAGILVCWDHADRRETDTRRMFGHVRVDYKLVLNVLGAVIFVALMGCLAQRGARSCVRARACDAWLSGAGRANRKPALGGLFP